MPLLAFVSCSKGDETPGGYVGEFAFDNGITSYAVGNSAQEFSLPVVTELSVSDWSVESSESWCVVTKFATVVLVRVTDNTEVNVRTANIVVTVGSDTYTVVLSQSCAQGSTESIPDDTKITVKSAYVSQQAYGYGIENTIDGIFNTSAIYDSPWSGQTKFPVELEYYFDGTEEMDYLLYYPRTNGSNGHFGEVDVYYKATSSSDYVLCASHDFGMQGVVDRVNFGETISPVAVKVSVKTGLSNLVACDEMEFYKSAFTGDLNDMILTVFADLSCSELNSGVDEDDIEQLPDFFKSIAYDMKYDIYERDFRIAEYKAYSNPVTWAAKLSTSKYARYNNPTGIHVKAGDEIVVLVGDTYGNDLALDCVYFTTTNCGAVSSPLVEGTNKITMTQTGLLFINYVATDIQAVAAKPVKVHIANGCGTVDGYYDNEIMADDAIYAELLDNASFTHFVVKGRNVIQAFHRTSYKTYAPNVISDAIEFWDEVLDYQHGLMGLDDIYGTEMNNLIFAFSFSDDSSYMWATDYKTAFTQSTLYNLVSKNNMAVTSDNSWGIAHEIGHVNQGAINWGGCTESSNNLFSNYTRYMVGINCSRGSEIWQLADRRLNNYAWINLNGTGGEDMELHMRMNWQLWIYYHRCGFNEDFWPELFAELRANPLSTDVSQAQLDFAKAASKVAGENLFDFFETWGFFQECDREYVYDYGNYYATITAEMVAETKAYMEQFPDTKPFYYIEDRLQGDTGSDGYELGNVGYYTSFKDNKKITSSVQYTLTGRSINITGGTEAVAFEVRRDSDNERLYFFNYYAYDIPDAVELSGASFYAVQADGERILITEKS